MSNARKKRRELVRFAEKLGATVESIEPLNSGHYRIILTYEGRRFVGVESGTSSDWRAAKNTMARIRRFIAGVE